jgi:hypothetical protein
MGTTLVSQIDIDASPEQVWRLLTDLSAYPEWNPFIVRAEGRVEVGSRLTLRMQPVGGRPATLRPTIVQADEGSCLRWRGSVGVRGILDAEHVFRITARTAAGRACTRTSTSLAYWRRCWPSRCIARLVRRSMP